MEHAASNSSSGSLDPTVPMSEGAKVYALVVFLITWVMISPSKWAAFPLGRATSSLLGAALMLVAGILPFNEAMLIVGSNMEVMALLFGLMVIAYFLGKEGLYENLEFVFTWRCKNAFDLVFRVVFLCGILSALITNDAVCIFITPLIAKIGRKYDLPGGPILIALGTAANIGSAATITGNPQNALIAIKGNIGYTHFAMYMAPIALICLGLNLGFLYLMYYKKLVNRAIGAYQLAAARDPSMRAALIEEQPDGAGVGTMDADDEQGANADDTVIQLEPVAGSNGAARTAVATGATTAAATATPSATKEEDGDQLSGDQLSGDQLSGDQLSGDQLNGDQLNGDQLNGDRKDGAIKATGFFASPSVKRKILLLARVLTLLSSGGVFVALLLGVPIGLASFAGGMAVIAIQAALRLFEPHDVVTHQIDYGLLLFFAGLFICIESFNRTGYPEAAQEAMFGQLDLASPLGMFVFVVAVVIASNTLSNVPAVLLIAPFIDTLPSHLAFAYWVMAAWVTTVAGNLTIIGSAANIIVAERAVSLRYYDMGFWEFFKFGSWTTIIILAAGCIPLYVLLVAS